MAERIFVVGHSAVTCLGRDIEETWEGLIAGRSGIRRHALKGAGAPESALAGVVEGSDDPSVKLPVRSIHLAMAAARAAWADAGLDKADGAYDRDRVAVAVGSAFGGVDFYEEEHARLVTGQARSVKPHVVPGLIINQAAGQVAQHLGLFGPSVAAANACASGGHSIALAALLLRAGEVDLALCGATESAITPAILSGFAATRALFGRDGDDRSARDPGQASRPFSVDRAGFVLAEGAGMLVLATESATRRLGLEVQAELVGWALNSDGHHMVIPHRERIARCLAGALARSGIRPEEVDYYNAHGTSTTVNDRVETEALKDVFGAEARRLPVSSIKGALGHSLGAASAVEAAVCVHALGRQVIPPTINHVPDPELDLDYVPNQARPASVEVVLSASFGFGGTNNALVFRRRTDD